MLNSILYFKDKYANFTNKFEIMRNILLTKMKKTIIILFALFFTGFTILRAQQEEKPHLKLVGFGLHIEQFKLNDLTDLTSAPVNKLIVTINPTQKFRIEPEFGFKFGTNDKTKLKSSTINFGIGAFRQIQRNKLNIYGGLRFEYGLMSIEHNSYNGMTQIKETDKLNRRMFGPALGGEYFLGNNFSIGGEINILYVTINNKIDGYDDKSNYTSTNSGLFLRFYF